MNWDQIEGKWKQMKGSVRKQWGKLSDDDVEFMAGSKDQAACRNVTALRKKRRRSRRTNGCRPRPSRRLPVARAARPKYRSVKPEWTVLFG